MHRRGSAKSRHILVDSGGTFEAFPNGHRHFLVRSAKSKLVMDRLAVMEDEGFIGEGWRSNFAPGQDQEGGETRSDKRGDSGSGGLGIISRGGGDKESVDSQWALFQKQTKEQGMDPLPEWPDYTGRGTRAPLQQEGSYDPRYHYYDEELSSLSSTLLPGVAPGPWNAAKPPWHSLRRQRPQALAYGETEDRDGSALKNRKESFHSSMSSMQWVRSTGLDGVEKPAQLPGAKQQSWSVDAPVVTEEWLGGTSAGPGTTLTLRLRAFWETVIDVVPDQVLTLKLVDPFQEGSNRPPRGRGALRITPDMAKQAFPLKTVRLLVLEVFYGTQHFANLKTGGRQLLASAASQDARQDRAWETELEWGGSRSIKNAYVVCKLLG